MSDLNKPITLEDLLNQLVAPGELSNTLAKTYKKLKIKTPLDLFESNTVLNLTNTSESVVHDLNIIPNNNHSSESESNNVPVLFDLDTSQYYFDLPTPDTDYTTRFWLNPIHAAKYPGQTGCEEGEFVYDYFASGEVYLNIPENIYITSVAKTFFNVYKNHIVSPTGKLKEHPGCTGYSPSGHVVSCLSPSVDPHISSPVYAWKFGINTFFNTVSSSEVKDKKKVISPAPCQYLTYHANDTKITSADYAFANVPPNIALCSSPVLSSKSSMTLCSSFHLGRIDKHCPHYVALSTIIKTTTVTPLNSENIINIQMRYSATLTGDHSFVIQNITDNATLTTLNYDKESNYDEVLVEANNIFEEFISCYDAHTLEDKNIEQEKISVNKVSYIQTLIGA
jgi:hypothetical protein